MNPFYFGPSSEPLYGNYFPAAQNTPGKRGVVICQPLWQEYIHAHWACVQVAQGLSRQGLHVLLFDYFGTGDSSGATGECTVLHWQEDIACAIKELQDISGVREYGLIGVRFGAALASGACAAKGVSPFAIGYWDPIFSGAAYLDELAEFHRLLAAADEKIESSTGDGLIGFCVPPNLRESIKRFDPGMVDVLRRKPYYLVYSEKTPSLINILENAAKDRHYKGECFVDQEGGWRSKDSYDKILMPRIIPEKLVSFFSSLEK